MATKGSPAIKALEDEIASIEKAQKPTRDKISELENELVEGQQIIARNRAAIDVLNGNVAVASAPSRRRRSSSSGGTINEDRVIDFIGAHQPVGASAIGQHVGVTGQTLSRKLSDLIENGKIVKEGERRGTKYSLKVGS